MDGADLNKKNLKNKKKLFKRGFFPFLKTPETDCRLTLVKMRVLFDPGDAQNINTWISLAKSPKKTKPEAFKSSKPSKAQSLQKPKAFKSPKHIHDEFCLWHAHCGA